MKLLHLIGDLVTWCADISFLRTSKIQLEIFYVKAKACFRDIYCCVIRNPVLRMGTHLEFWFLSIVIEVLLKVTLLAALASTVMAATVLIAALLMLCKGPGTSSSAASSARSDHHYDWKSSPWNHTLCFSDTTLLGRLRTFEGNLNSGARNFNEENIS